MTVQIFVDRDSDGRLWPPDYDHEALGCLDVIRKLWLTFHSSASLYLVASNLHEPSADFVILSELGIGVVEFKHHFGRIRQEHDETWYAGPIKIKAGSKKKGFKNPRRQVQAYAREIRSSLVRETHSPWLPGDPAVWSKFKLQTAVCFTNLDADIAGLRNQLRRSPGNELWEEFRTHLINSCGSE